MTGLVIGLAVMAVALVAVAHTLHDLLQRFEWRCAYDDKTADKLRQQIEAFGGTAERVQALRVGPGDTLVFQYRGTVSDQHYQRLSAALADMFPEGVKVLIMDNGLQLKTVTGNGQTTEVA